MAANKFATMLHRNTHRIIAILVYAALEWVLISMLLLNSLFGYLISKFAHFFGLKPPCPWCCRIDRVLKHSKKADYSFVDEMCETHAAEISKLSFCSNHHKLAESQGMCNNCFASRPVPDTSNGMTRTAFVSMVREDTCQNGDDILSCSCCKENLTGKWHPSCLLWKPSWSTSDVIQKGDLLIEEMVDENAGSKCEQLKKPDGLQNQRESLREIEDHNDEAEGVSEDHQVLSDVDSFSFREASEEDYSKSLSSILWNEKEDGNEDIKEATSEVTEKYSYGVSNRSPTSKGKSTISCRDEDDLLNAIDLQHKDCDACDWHRVIPVDLIDYSTNENTKFHALVEEHLRKCDHQHDAAFTSNLVFETEIGLLGESFIVDDEIKKSAYAEMKELGIYMVDVESASILPSEEGKLENEDASVPRAAQTLEADDSKVEADGMEELNEPTGAILKDEMGCMEIAADLTARSAKLPTSDQSHPQKLLTSLQLSKENLSLVKGQNADITDSLNEFEPQDGHDCHVGTFPPGPADAGKSYVQETMLTAESQANPINFQPTEIEAEEEKFPETPTSVESLHCLHKKLLLSEKRESSIEESLDGSVLSEMEVGDGVISIERLKVALKAERKALSALYAELEEERSASAVATNQTMAMITRLQEEKAAMQMEALQYQRMMEEQSEYDQEALQLLNELMIKREREKEELEKELVMYRQKVSDYEAMERMRAMRSTRPENWSSKSSSDFGNNAEDSDNLYIDLNHELRGNDAGLLCGHQGTNSPNNAPTDEVSNLEEMALDCVKHMTSLDDSLAEFEEERLSILDQLKELEEKLLIMSSNEEFMDDKNLNEQFSIYDENDSDERHNFTCPEHNGVLDTLPKEPNENYHPEKETMCLMAKRLLPLLDAKETEIEDGMVVQDPSENISKFEEDGKKLAIEEEVDHVYERLQALEADREFLKHCMNSIQKGDKGMNLLQEILQHLRDLKGVELRSRNTDEGN
ncbi:myosin-binding protein 3 isoform X2 [Rhodamnia argentea]|uniref:Myosin-binding protein 3 isoform X2 n=1 Tax=Rhodamnia argentea TaxID=178133 RepID=A0A8B8PPJ6_9MYRT|nr:myosin-binding protein 3 isoform X2 [Rhodamnia argentea]